MLNPNLDRGGISRRTGLLLKVAALCLLLPLAALRLPGQNLSGKFTGTILDPSGGAVPNATIVMTNHKANTCAPSLALPPCTRSEEHTSELQSHSDLVCRLLLEKKKKKQS